MRNRIVTEYCAMLGIYACLLVVCPLVSAAPPASKSEQTIWDLEHSYWKYVQQNDLSAYLQLWHKDFLGWPSVNDAPVHKDHITDWITSQTGKGLSFQLIEFQPAAIQSSPDLVVVCYWVTSKWVDKAGASAERTLRITHTWIKDGTDWKIIGGMSMPEAANSHKQ